MDCLMRYVKLIIISMSLFGNLFAGNKLIIPGAKGFPGDTLAITVEIQNSDPFVGFQLDLDFPQEIEFIAGTEKLSGRAQDQTLKISMLDDSTVRVVAFSLSSSEFLNNSGVVMSFKTGLDDTPGEYELKIVDPVIGNAQAQNIITGFENGVITILGITGLKQTDNMTTSVKYCLFDNYPNPFNNNTNIQFSVPEIIDLKLKIVDLSGKEIMKKQFKRLSSGYHIVEWNGTDNSGEQLGSGCYFYSLIANQFCQTKKMIYL